MLDLDDTKGDLVLVENAVVVPPDGMGRTQASGVLDAAGRFVSNSISWSSPTVPLNTAPQVPDLSATVDVPGTHLFAGIAYGHFGHFITESMARIWAIDEVRGEIDSLIFTPKQQTANNVRVLEDYKNLMLSIGIDVPGQCFGHSVRVEKLYVPRQGFGVGELTRGSEKFRSYINRHAGKDVAPAGARKIYISRSKLPPQRGGLLGEAKLERYLSDEGYEMFHPQKETQEKQLAQYKAAERIISVDCSPLHLVGYVGNSSQVVGIVERRDMNFSKDFVQQLTLFKGMQCHVINALVNDWLPVNSSRPSRRSFGEVKFSAMYAQLRKAGLISSEVPWTDLTEDERAEDLRRLEVSHQMAFKPHRPDCTYRFTQEAK